MKNGNIIYPSPPLSQYVKYYWVVKTNSTVSNAIQTIPSGCIHLVFHRGNDLYFSTGDKQPKNFIRGQLSFPGTLSFSGNIDMIAIIFYPLGLIPFLKLPSSEVYNQYLDIDTIRDTGLNELKTRISNEENTTECIRLIEHFLLNRIRNANDYNYNRISDSIQSIKEQTSITVSGLADKACLGYRHFKRVFTKYTGMSPKEFIKVIRFQRTLHSLQNMPAIDMAQLAYSSGFYDQPHLVKDFKSMSGCTPTEYVSSRKPHSTFFSNECRINLINY
ncbi:MAG: helix-turn-helix domain-containing protein [Tannerella sp.]|nr:helix-turn-helix domain-containing protein [Tannerella sp.]